MGGDAGTRYSEMVQTIMLDNAEHFNRLLETRQSDIDAEIDFLCYPIGSKKELKLLKRTPLMIAAMVNSPKVVNYIVRSRYIENIDKESTSDRATAIKCATDNGSSPTIILMLKYARDARIWLGDFFSPKDLPPMHQQGQAQNSPRSFRARDAAGELPSSSDDQVNQNMTKCNIPSMHQQGQDLSFPRSFHARDSAGELPLSSDDQVNQNMAECNTSQVCDLPSDACESSNDSSDSLVGTSLLQKIKADVDSGKLQPIGEDTNLAIETDEGLVQPNGVLEIPVKNSSLPILTDVPAPSYANIVRRPSRPNDQVHQNMNHSQQGRQEPNSPTASSAKDPAGERPLSSDDQVNQNMNHIQQETQESQPMNDPSTPDPVKLNEYMLPTSENDPNWPFLKL